MKDASKYKIDIYKTIKDSPCFPKYFGYVELPDNRVLDVLKLQKIYYKAAHILLDQIKDPSDPSIENADRIIESTFESKSRGLTKYE